MEVFVIITVQKQDRPGVLSQCTWHGTCDVGSKATRADVYRKVMAEAIPEEFRGKSWTLFYSAEPLRVDAGTLAAGPAPAPAVQTA